MAYSGVTRGPHLHHCRMTPPPRPGFGGLSWERILRLQAALGRGLRMAQGSASALEPPAGVAAPNVESGRPMCFFEGQLCRFPQTTAPPVPSTSGSEDMPRPASWCLLDRKAGGAGRDA